MAGAADGQEGAGLGRGARCLPEAARQPGPPEKQVILLETLLEVDQLLDDLPSLVKHAFVLSQLGGQSHAQIAATLGISIPTVKRSLTKALRRCYLAETARPH